MQDDRQEQPTVQNPDLQSELDRTETQGQEQQTEADVHNVEAQKPDEAAKAEEYLNLLQRTQADFINYRRRISQEQTELRVAAQSELLTHVFPILDDLQRALTAAPDDLLKHPWVEGIFLISKRLMSELEQLGVRQFGSTGEPFDPHRHEAVMTEERSDVPPGTVLQVLRPGYTFGERVIRPAQVVVARELSAANT